MPSFFTDPSDRLSPAESERARKAMIARRNAALSTGPTTAAGKSISSKNALKHGFAAVNPVIDIEDHEAFDAHVSAYMDRFQPADQVEADTVRRAAIAMWKHDRIVATEAALFNLEFDYHECLIDGRIEVGLDEGQLELDPIHKMAVCFKEAAGDRAFDLCRRYLIAANRDHDDAIRTFYFLESKRRNVVAEAAVPQEEPEIPRKPNEPTPNSQQSAPVTPIHAKSQPKRSAAVTPNTTEAKNPVKIA